MKTKILTLLVLTLILIVGCQSDPIEESSLNKKSGRTIIKMITIKKNVLFILTSLITIFYYTKNN